VNERFYHEHKDRPSTEILAAFCTSYQQVLITVQVMGEKTLNAPLLWRSDGHLIWTLIAEDTYEHYQEHGNAIRRRPDRSP